MSKTTNRSKSSTTFQHPFTVKVRPTEFEPLASLRSLDFGRLSKGSHKVEIGIVKGGCCGKLVRAVISKGMVTGVEVERCKDTERASPELLKLIKEATRRIAPGAGTRFQPFPVSDLSDSAAVALMISVKTCITICIFGTCFQCCSETRTGSPDITVCGRFPDRSLA
jgi:hypothetical protein